MNETGLFYRISPSKTIAARQKKGSKKDKTRITVAFTANADGSQRLPPFFLGRSKSISKKSALEPGFLYRFNKKDWQQAMTELNPVTL